MSLEEKKAKLLSWLQTALELELATIPPYLIALLSIRLPRNRRTAELIRSIMMEEMLHLALVANLISALGSSPRIGPSNVPRYPLTLEFEGKAFRDRRFPVNLAPFSEETVRTFMMLEAPQEFARPKFVTWDLTIPGLTIGEFYMNIVELLAELDAALPAKLFIGDPTRQLEQDFYWGGGGMIVPVHDLASAKVALSLVITQGEGAWSEAAGALGFAPDEPMFIGHYYRFSEIFHRRRYRKDDDPFSPPTGEAFEVDYGAVFPMKINPSASDYPDGSPLAAANRAFNISYTTLLKQLEEAFNGTPKTLYTATINGMHALPPIARSMLTTPIPGDDRRRTGCPTFEWTEATAQVTPQPALFSPAG